MLIENDIPDKLDDRVFYTIINGDIHKLIQTESFNIYDWYIKFRDNLYWVPMRYQIRYKALKKFKNRASDYGKPIEVECWVNDKNEEKNADTK